MTHEFVRSGSMPERDRDELRNAAVLLLILVLFLELVVLSQQQHPLLHYALQLILYLVVGLLVRARSGVCVQSAAAGGVLARAMEVELSLKYELRSAPRSFKILLFEYRNCLHCILLAR